MLFSCRSAKYVGSIVSLAAIVALSCGGSAVAKARLIAIYQIRSTPELAPRALKYTQELATRIGAVDGYDAKVLAAPASGSLGAAAATVGAETYVVGQVVASGESQFDIKLGSFSAATDKPMAEWSTSVSNNDALPDRPPLASLLPGTTGSTAAVPTDTSVGSTTVATGLPIVMTLDAPLTSGSAKVGDKFSLRSVDDVAADGKIIVTKGAQGEGEVMSVETAGGNGHPGKLGIQFNWITAIDGAKIKLSNTQHSSDGEGSKGAASTATIATYVLLGPLGLFAHNWVKGKELTIDTQKKLTAYVDHTVHVVSSTKSDLPASGGFAK